MKLLLLLALSLPLFSQCTTTGTYNLAAEGEVITLYQPNPSSQTKTATHSTFTITFVASSNVNFQLETQTDPAITGNAQAVVPIYPNNMTCTTLAKKDSTIPVGNIVGQYFLASGSGQITIDTSAFLWNPSQHVQSLTLRILSTTANISVNWLWAEK